MTTQFQLQRRLRSLPLTTSVALFAFTLIVASPLRAVVPTYTFQDLYEMNVPSGFIPPSTVGSLVVIRGMTTGGAAGGYGRGMTFDEHAVMWTNTGVPTDLNPAGFSDSRVNGVYGGQQVGDGKSQATGNNTHALLWNGTNSAIDLNPAGFKVSEINGIGGGQEVGHAYVTDTPDNHAMLWNGTNPAIDLNPVGIRMSIALATDGGHQVGYGSGTATGNTWHALLWNNTNVAVDLHPADFVDSEATDVSGQQEVGFGHSELDSDRYHALLWNGTNTAIDLHPDGFYESQAYSTNGTQQVGYGDFFDEIGAHYQALLWNGTNVPIDLGMLLPANFGDSSAYKIDADGDVFGIARDSDGMLHAVEWVAVPEPTLSGAAALIFVTAMSRRRRAF